MGVESKGEAEGFVLGWSKKEKIWIAVYRVVVQISAYRSISKISSSYGTHEF